MNSGGSRAQLTFHSVCGENVRILKQGRVAKRHESFCKGLAFSARPVEVDEIVVMKLAETASNWSGVLRFGVTNTNPQTLAGGLPKYACPDLTNKEGNWAKALTERYCQQGNYIHFYVTVAGEMYYGINGANKGLFLSGINCSLPMYVLLDIYGNSTCVEFIDPSDVPSLRMTMPGGRPPGQSSSSTNRTNDSSISSNSNVSPNPMSDSKSGTMQRQSASVASNNVQTATMHRTMNENNQALATAQIALELNQRLAGGVGGPSTSHQHSSVPSTASFPPRSLPPLKYNTGNELVPIEFHQVCGKNITLSSDKFIATRKQDEYSNGYVFIKRPVRLNEKIIIQVLKVLPQYSGSIAFGVTTCDPIQLARENLPDDSDLLVDRKEYWVVNKDVAGGPSEMDELTFYVNEKGEVHFQRNNISQRIIMHVDHTQRLYLFFDVFGTTLQIRLVGSVEVKPLRTSSVPSSVHTDRRQSLNVSRMPMTSQNSAPASPGPRQQSYGGGPAVGQFVHLPPAQQPNIPRIQQHQHRTASTNSLPSIPHTNVAPNSFFNNQNGSTNVRHRAPALPSHNNQPPPRPPPPHWQQHHDIPQTNLPASNSSSDVASGMPPKQTSVDAVAGLSTAVGQMSVGGGRKSNEDESNEECVVCMTNRVDCVLYTCGHMCMCYACAVQTWQRHSYCPVCRQSIKDVIKAYKSS